MFSSRDHNAEKEADDSQSPQSDSSATKEGRKYFNRGTSFSGARTGGTSKAGLVTSRVEGEGLIFSSPTKERSITQDTQTPGNELPPRAPSPSPRSITSASAFVSNKSSKTNYEDILSTQSDEDIVDLSTTKKSNSMMTAMTLQGATQGPSNTESEYDVAGILGNLSAIGDSEETRLSALRPRPSSSDKERSSSSPSPTPPLSSSSAAGRATSPRIYGAPPPRHQHKRNVSGGSSSGSIGHHVRRATTGTGGQTSELTDASILQMFSASPGETFTIRGKVDVDVAVASNKGTITPSASAESEESLNSVNLQINNVDVLVKQSSSPVTKILRPLGTSDVLGTGRGNQRPPRGSHIRRSSAEGLLRPSSFSSSSLREGHAGVASEPNTPPPTPISKSRDSSDSMYDEGMEDDNSSSVSRLLVQKQQQPSGIFRSRENSPTPLSTISGGGEEGRHPNRDRASSLRSRHRVTFSSENLVQLYKVATADDAEKIANDAPLNAVAGGATSGPSDNVKDSIQTSGLHSGSSLANLSSAEAACTSKMTHGKRGGRNHRRARTVTDVSSVSNVLLLATSSVDSTSDGDCESSLGTSVSKNESAAPQRGLKAFLHKHAKTATSTTLGSFLSRGSSLRQASITKEEVLDQQFIKLESLIQKYNTGDHPLVLKQWNCIGNIQFYYGMHDKAIKSYGEALRGFRGVYGDAHHMVALTLFHRATAKCCVREFDEAILDYQSAFQIWRNESGAEALETGKVLHCLGQTYLWKGQLQDAHEALNKALYIRRVHLGQNHDEVARTLGLLAQVHMKLDEMGRSNDTENHSAKSLMLFKEALRMKRVTLGRHHMSTVYAMLDVARCYTLQQPQIADSENRSQLQAALTMYGDALYIQKSLSINLPVGSEELHVAQQEMANILHTMSFIHRRLGQLREEKRELAEALRLYQAASKPRSSSNAPETNDLLRSRIEDINSRLTVLTKNEEQNQAAVNASSRKM